MQPTETPPTETPKSQPYFVKEAWPFVLPPLAGGVLLAALGWVAWGVGLVAVGLLVLLFFRNPHRGFAGRPDTVLAAADGLVTRVDEIEDPEVGPGPRPRVVTFLSVFNVHVQRAPADGEVVAQGVRQGRKVAAFNPDADTLNESRLTVFRLAGGERLGVRQIVGLVARRAVCYLSPGQTVERGELMGVIKFGSRVDLVLPPGYRVLVAKGDRVRCGETPMALPPEVAAEGTHRPGDAGRDG